MNPPPIYYLRGTFEIFCDYSLEVLEGELPLSFQCHLSPGVVLSSFPVAVKINSKKKIVKILQNKEPLNYTTSVCPLTLSSATHNILKQDASLGGYDSSDIEQ